MEPFGYSAICGLGSRLGIRLGFGVRARLWALRVCVADHDDGVIELRAAAVGSPHDSAPVELEG